MKYIPTFESFLNEEVYVNPSKYVIAHGKNPTGKGIWGFEIANKVFTTPNSMDFADAKKWAADKAKEMKVNVAYVLG
jgi:hypothetical protein